MLTTAVTVCSCVCSFEVVNLDKFVAKWKKYNCDAVGLWESFPHVRTCVNLFGPIKQLPEKSLVIEVGQQKLCIMELEKLSNPCFVGQQNKTLFKQV